MTRQGKHDTRPLLTSSRDDLIQRLHALNDPIQSFTANLDMTPALGSVYKGEITEFHGVSGYVIFRKPDDIHIIGLDPVIHSKAFDMLSKGNTFELYLPSRNKFIEGRNDLPPNSKNKIENLRPAAFVEAMLIYPPDPKTEIPVLQDDTDEEHALYILLILKKMGDEIEISRSVYFDRLTLRVVEQKAFDKKGQTVSDTRYSEWKADAGVIFPSKIDINRPEDGYGVVMTLVKLQLNNNPGDDKFVLTRPEGTPLQVLGEPAPPSSK